MKYDKVITKIVKHIEIINHELGSVKNDLKWIKRIMYYMATIVTAGLIGGII